jgi:hypothetical protein
MINPENVQKFKSYGFILTPVHKSKDPKVDKNPVCNAKTNWTWSNKVVMNGLIKSCLTLTG